MIKHLTRLAVLAAAGLALAGCAGSPAAGGSDTGTLRLGPLQSQNPLTLAAGGGLLAEKVTAAGGTLDASAPFPAFAPAAEALGAGQIDMTSGSSTAVITALQGNPDLRVFAVEQDDNDTQGIVAAPDRGIATIADLRGRSIAVNKGGTGDYILRMALAKEGMTIADVRPVYLGPADAATAFTGGRVDAWATWDQFLVTAQQVPGARLVTLAKDIGATNRTVHVVTQSFYAAHPDLVQAAYQALVEQTQAEAADPSILVEAYEKAGAAPEVAEAIGQKKTPQIVPADAAFAAELGTVAQFYADQGLTTALTDVSQAVIDVSTDVNAS